MLYCETWGDNEDELDKVVEKLTTELSLYEQKFTNIAKEHDKILERCKCIAIKTQPKVTDSRTRNTTTAPIAPSNNCFKPQSDLKPIFLAKDCTLPEYNTFEKTFIIYMKSAQTIIPREAVFSHLRVHVDPWWYIELKEKGLDSNTSLESLPQIMDLVAREKSPSINGE